MQPIKRPLTGWKQSKAPQLCSLGHEFAQSGSGREFEGLVVVADNADQDPHAVPAFKNEIGVNPAYRELRVRVTFLPSKSGITSLSATEDNELDAEQYEEEFHNLAERAFVACCAEPWKTCGLPTGAITWHTPPKCQGQMVEVSYASGEDGLIYRRTWDHSDSTRTYSKHLLDDGESFEPWNVEPN